MPSRNRPRSESFAEHPHAALANLKGHNPVQHRARMAAPRSGLRPLAHDPDGGARRPRARQRGLDADSDPSPLPPQIMIQGDTPMAATQACLSIPSERPRTGTLIRVTEPEPRSLRSSPGFASESSSGLPPSPSPSESRVASFSEPVLRRLFLSPAAALPVSAASESSLHAVGGRLIRPG